MNLQAIFYFEDPGRGQRSARDDRKRTLTALIINLQAIFSAKRRS